jgi:hypothetical protein
MALVRRRRTVSAMAVNSAPPSLCIIGSSDSFHAAEHYSSIAILDRKPTVIEEGSLKTQPHRLASII